MCDILFIAPLSPPITGHSLAADVLLDSLIDNGREVTIVNLSKDSFEEGVDSFQRIKDIVKILVKVWRGRQRAEKIYLTISESLMGNIKDLFIYLICFRKLSNTYIHLHGGSIKRLLWNKNKFIYAINRFFIKRLAGVIILGKSHLDTFDGIIPLGRINIVPNFSQDYLFISNEAIKQKFSAIGILNILYMSNLIPLKGYSELLEAFFLLPVKVREGIKLHFAGGFGSETSKEVFLTKIKDIPNISYHGVATGDRKKELFFEAHVFCLPTSYLEGQPISILEAYASGCVVLTTEKGGIPDIFDDGINGFSILERSSIDIKNTIEKTFNSRQNIMNIALNNRRIAEERYRTSEYIKSMHQIVFFKDKANE